MQADFLSAIDIELKDENETANFAQQLAMQPHIVHAFITLQGDLGAGKTTLVRHLLRALDVSGRIKSPTYAVVEPYTGAGGLAIWHFDFYRFNDPHEWEDAGVRDIIAAQGLKLAEWPQKAPELAAAADVQLRLQAVDEQRRRLSMRACSHVGAALIAPWVAAARAAQS